MSRRSLVAASAVVFALLAGPVSAESFRNPPGRPLLVMTTYSTTATPSDEPQDPRVFVSALFIFADRTLIQSFNHSPEPFGVHPQVSSYVRGRIPTAQWNAMLTHMTNARIDVQENCQIPRIGAPTPFHPSTIERVVRWYGRQGRANTFTISLGDDTPDCALSTLFMTDAISRAAEKVDAASTSERFSVP